ncbi:MAG: glycosyltransferase family 1 protein, partial [Acidimicrobiales bacterium]
MKVAVDATPLLGARTGVGALTQGTLDALSAHPELDLELCAYALSWRGRAALASVLPAGVATVRGPMAARPL